MPMKKIIVLLATSVLFGACKKDYTCECIESPGNTINKYTIKNATKRQAKANCYSKSTTISGILIKEECTLK